MDEPANEWLGGNRLPERHQMPLAIRLRWRGTNADDAVEVPILVFARHARLEEEQAHHKIATPSLCDRAQSRHVLGRHLVGKHRQRGFWQDDQPPLGLRDEIGVKGERLVAIVRIELELLFDVALHQADGERLACGAAPLDRA